MPCCHPASSFRSPLPKSVSYIILIVPAFLPDNNLASIVSVLNTNNESFAIKSGGHNPNNYFSSIAGGPLISTQKLDEAILDQETGILQAGPGNRLDGISAKLQ